MKKNKKKSNTPYGNRCGHSPTNPRFCDLTKRGKGGHPPVIGLIVSLLQQAYRDRTKLTTWQNMNPSGRRRRSDGCEPMVAVNQFMIAQWFQLGTRRCAVPSGFFLQAPDVEHIANKISKSKSWQGNRLSEERIHTVFSEFEKCGYMKSTQVKTKKTNGAWVSSPAVRLYTKKFFVELGGYSLWEKVRQSGHQQIEKIKPIAAMSGLTLKELLSADEIATPRKINYYKQLGINANPLFFSEKPKYKNSRVSDTNSAAIRETIEYKRVLAQKILELRFTHPPDDPRRTFWPPDERADNARRITDKIFNISAA